MTDRQPQPSDGPDYHADLAAWRRRQDKLGWRTYHGYNRSGNPSSSHLVTVDLGDGQGERLLAPAPGPVKSSEYSWGYAGSGPAETARSILFDHLGEEVHPACYQAYKAQVVARWPQDGDWSTTGSAITDWLIMYRQRDRGPITVAERQAELDEPFEYRQGPD